MKKYIIIIFCIIIFILQFVTSLPSRNNFPKIPKDANYICFVDFGKLSCYDRLYIYDVNKNKYIYSARVQHGNGGKSTATKPEFSNKIGSNCSSLGLYKIIALDKMQSNKSIDCFRLRGLSPTNSNAERRGILIHPSISLSVIPKFPGLVIPLTSESRGCFAVSIVTMERIKRCYKEGNIYIYAYKSN